MDDTARRELTLNEEQSDGAIVLPGCKLILEYECNMPVDLAKGKEKRVREGDRYSPGGEIDTICDDLIEILKTREDLNMCIPGRRTVLLRKFSSRELALLERDLKDMLVDLPRIVDHVAKRLEKLDVLIDEAISLAQNDTTKRKLQSILQRYKEGRDLEKRTVMPTENDLA